MWSATATGTMLPNAVVLLLLPRGHGGPLAGAVANNSGSYTIPAPPGTYVPVAFKSNYVCQFLDAAGPHLGSGQTVTNNVTLTNATSSISGKLVDANNSSIGLPGSLGPGAKRPMASWGRVSRTPTAISAWRGHRRPVADPRGRHEPDCPWLSGIAEQNQCQRRRNRC